MAVLALVLAAAVAAIAAGPAVAGTTAAASPNATANAATTASTISLENASATPNETVTLDLTIRGSPAAGYLANVSYDPDAVTLVSVDGGDFAAPVANRRPERGRVVFTQSRSTAVNASPIVAAQLTVRLERAADAQLVLEDDTVINDESGSLHSPALVDGAVAVAGHESTDGGDDGDGGGSLPVPDGGTDDESDDGSDADDVRTGDDGPENDSADGEASDDGDANDDEGGVGRGQGDDGNGQSVTATDEAANGSDGQSGSVGGDATPGFGVALALFTLLAVGALRRR